MHIRIDDGKAVFATHILKTNIKDKAIPFQVEEEGIVCYSEDEKTRAEAMLKKQKIKYTVSKIKTKDYGTEGIKYANRSEAIRHLENGQLPESEDISLLRKELAYTREKTLLLEESIKTVTRAKEE